MPKAIRGEKKTPPVMLSHDSPLLVEGAFPPKRNDVLLPNTKGRGGGPPRPPAGYQPSFRVRNGWTEGTAAGELRVFQSRNEETRMFRAATAPAKNAVRSSPPGGEGPVGTEGAADAVPIQNSLKKRPFSIMMQNMNPAGFGTRSLWG